MTRFKNSACTSIMVGKKASMDGSTFIARNEDRVVAIEPKRFIVQPAVSGRDETYVSPYNKLTVKLPATGMRYTATPSGDQSMGQMKKMGLTKQMLVKVPPKVFTLTIVFSPTIHTLRMV